jgi:D-2-hydroxyacid dehydrogenase (NADP+)
VFVSSQNGTTILVSEGLHGGGRVRLEAALQGLGAHRLLVLRRGEALGSELLEQVDVALFSRDSYVAGSEPWFEAVEQASNLRWMHVFHAGVNGPRYRNLLERGVALTTSAGTHAEPIAQTTMAALLWLARPMTYWLRAQREHRWARITSPEEPRDLRGQVMLVVGVGSIGRHICRIGQALGLHVIGVRRSPRRADDFVDEMYEPWSLRDLLPRADWLVLACPLTEETRGLIDRDALARLPRRAHLLNVARGPVVDESALIAALERRQIAGAYLDVFEQEPLAEDSALWDLPNVIITPHNSAVSDGNDGRVLDIFEENLRRWHAGEPLVNQVDSID